MKRVFLFLALLLMQSGLARAEADAGTKLGRGLSNMAFGWFEIVNEIGSESDDQGPLIGVPSGIFRGAVIGLGRTLVGVLETVTFIFPDAKGSYEPIIKPASVFAHR